MSLKNYTTQNVTNTRQFNSALSTVFGSIAQRNNQIQQLLIIAVSEASRESGGQVTNNLDWLTRILMVAQETKGVNLPKMVKYVKEVLCCNTVSWNSEKNRLAKVNDKAVKLTYNTSPDIACFDDGKKETVAKVFDYGKRVTAAINSALSEDKGGMTVAEVMQAVMASDAVSLNDLMQAIEDINTIQEVA
jgi:hypothetical protein